MFKILAHELVPRHDILSAKERKEVLEKFGVAKEQLPKILATDPVIEEIQAKPGDIIKITRKSPTAGEAVYYRVVE